MSRLALLLLLLAMDLRGAEAPADLILHHGKIITVDPEFTIAGAIAVRGERILAVGENSAVLDRAAPTTHLVDLEGRVVLPGLIDSHLHALGAAMYEFDHPVPEMETIADVLAYVRSRAAALDDGQWIWVSQVFITRLREQRYPTRAELDQAAPRNPVVFRTGPDASLNSLALRQSGIDKDFRIADGKPGRIERHPETGEPTGILRSCARFIRHRSASRAPTDEDRLSRLKQLLHDYNSVGITSIVDSDTSDLELDMYRQLKERGDLTCRTFVALSVDAQMPMERIEARIDLASRSPLHEYDNLLWLRGAKCYLDGGMLTGSAYLRQPWGVSEVYAIEDPAYRGMRYIEPDKLRRIMRLALEHGLQFTAHSVGDGAVHAFLDACERLESEGLSVRAHRPCITHANFQSSEAVRTMARLGVVANMQPAWLYLDGATLLKQFGEQRLAYFQPYQTLFENEVIVGGGSDHMQKIGGYRSINPYDPFLGMWITLVRQPRYAADPLHPKQRLSREQAIRLYTINCAHLTFEEQEKGSLEPGKLADFIVLDRDILTCPLDEVRRIQVHQTYLGGKRVFARSGASG